MMMETTKRNEGMYDYQEMDFIEFKKTPVVLTDIHVELVEHLIRNETHTMCSQPHFSEFMASSHYRTHSKRKCKRCFSK